MCSRGVHDGRLAAFDGRGCPCPTAMRRQNRNAWPGRNLALRRFFKVGHSGKFWEIATDLLLLTIRLPKNEPLQGTEALRVFARKRTARGTKTLARRAECGLIL